MNLTNVWVADFETKPYTQYLKENKTGVWLFYIENLINDSSCLGLTLSAFMQYLFMKKNPIVYFHNLSFDGEFILHWLTNNGFTFNDSRKQEHMEFSYFKDTSNTIYSIRVRYNESTIFFKCSLKLVPMALDDIAKQMSLVKKETFNYNYNKEHYERYLSQVDKNEVGYIKNDVRVIKKTLQKAHSIIGLDKLTLASTSYSIWENNFDNERKYHFAKWTLTFEENRFLEQYYSGGLTLLNPKYANIDIKEKIYVADVNSLYPYVMKTFSLPYPSKIKEPCEDNCKNKKHLKLYHIEVDKFKIKDGYIPFVADSNIWERTKNEYLSESNETMIFSWTEIDLMSFKKYYTYENLVIKMTTCFKKGGNHLFKDYIDYFFNIKCTADKNSWEYIFAKILLNALYGKHGTRLNKPRKTLVESENRFYGKYAEVVTHITDDEYKLLHTTKKGKIENYFKPFAIFITSYARMYLIEAIQKNKKWFIYCDTDSIHSLRPLNLTKIDDTMLGYWKLEGIKHDDGTYYYGGKYICAKRYILYENPTGTELKVKISGMNKKFNWMVTKDNFTLQHVYQNGKTQRKAVQGGYVLISSDFTLKEI